MYISQPDAAAVEAHTRYLYEVFNSGNYDRMINFYAPDVEIVHPVRMSDIRLGLGGTKRGIDEVQNFFSLIPVTRGPMRIDLNELIVSGNRVVVFGTRHLTALDGRTTTLSCVQSWTFVNGKVTRFEDHFDTAEMCDFLSPEEARTAR
ncbi:MAG: nuclear transport factor 2 family protein [Pseudonocardiaceae bacterium]